MQPIGVLGPASEMALLRRSVDVRLCRCLRERRRFLEGVVRRRPVLELSYQLRWFTQIDVNPNGFERNQESNQVVCAPMRTRPAGGRVQPDLVALAGFGVVLSGVSALTLAAGRLFGRARRAGGQPGRTGPQPPGQELEEWALAGRRYGTLATWFLLGGSVFTAYTFIAVPALVYGVGAFGFFAVPYTIIVFQLCFVVLPWLHRAARRGGWVTPADAVRDRFGSPALALAVALTGILATMPYVALQLVGLAALLAVLGVPEHGPLANAALTMTFAVLAVGTYRYGMRAPALVAAVKAVLVLTTTAILVGGGLWVVGGPGAVIRGAGPVLAAHPDASLLLPSGLASSYITLAIGSALALILYPHVMMPAFAARSPDVLRRVSAGMLGWTTLLAVVAGAGLAAVGVRDHGAARPCGARRPAARSRDHSAAGRRGRSGRDRDRRIGPGSGDVGRRGVHVRPGRDHPATARRRVDPADAARGDPRLAIPLAAPAGTARRARGRGQPGHLAGLVAGVRRGDPDRGGGSGLLPVRRTGGTGRERRGVDAADAGPGPGRGAARPGPSRRPDRRTRRTGGLGAGHVTRRAGRPPAGTGLTSTLNTALEPALDPVRVRPPAGRSRGSGSGERARLGLRDLEREAAVTVLFDRHHADLVRMAVLLGADDAEDVVAEAFCELYRRWPADGVGLWALNHASSDPPVVFDAPPPAVAPGP